MPGGKVVLGIGPGEKGHGCGPCTLTTSCLKSLQEWGTRETTEDAESRVQAGALEREVPPSTPEKGKRIGGPRALHKLSKDS